MYDLYYHSRFLAINFLSHFAARLSKRPFNLPKESFEAKHFFWNKSFSLTEIKPKLCRIFKNVSTEISKQDFTRLRGKSFPCRKKQKGIFLGTGANFFRLLAERFHQCFLSCVIELRKTKFSKFVFPTSSQLAQNKFKFFGDESDTCLSELQSIFFSNVG